MKSRLAVLIALFPILSGGSNRLCQELQKSLETSLSFPKDSIGPGWKVIGPGGGGGILLPTISPFDENFVLTHCDMTGAYVTHNGGADWRMFNLWTVPNDFEFDPVNPNTIYIATRRYRTAKTGDQG